MEKSNISYCELVFVFGCDHGVVAMYVNVLILRYWQKTLEESVDVYSLSSYGPSNMHVWDIHEAKCYWLAAREAGKAVLIIPRKGHGQL